MHYVTVFDASDPPYRVYDLVIWGICFIIINAMMALPPGWFGRLALLLRSQRVPIWAGLVFSLYWTGAVFVSVNHSFTQAGQAIANNQCQTIEGRVEHFHPMPWQGHDKERFDVNGVMFSYSDYIVTGGFNTTVSHGGPVKEGLPVRICHLGGLIMRLEATH